MTLVKSKKIEHQYELGNGSYAQIDPTGGITVYNEDNIVVLSGRQTEVLKYALGFYDLPPEPKPICATCNDIHPDDGYYDHDFTAVTNQAKIDALTVLRKLVHEWDSGVAGDEPLGDERLEILVDEARAALGSANSGGTKS